MVLWQILLSVALLAIFLLFLAAYLTGCWERYLQVTKRDLRGMSILVRLRYRFWRASREDIGINAMFLQTVQEQRHKIAIVDIATDKTTTFGELDRLACQYGHLLQNNGIGSNDVVAIMMENSMNYVAAWLGVAKLGAVSAWINTNLKQDALEHSLSVSNAKCIICDGEFKERIQRCSRNTEMKIFPHVGTLCTSPNGALYDFPENEPITDAKPSFKDPFCYIFTSGTTGLPKAAVIKCYRFFYIVNAAMLAFRIRPQTDVLYICLPMYHTSAGILGIGQTVLFGGTAVIRKKFSASNFWKDCCKYDCTVSQYIGELLRYILLSPPCTQEKEHKVRLLIGNGLRPAIWRQFQERFNIETIGEFYGSTEGTSNLVNIDGKEGSCGFMTTITCLTRLYPVRLLKVQEDTGELVRDEKGFCILANPGESGALGCTIKKNNLLLNFEGYLDKEETAKKIIQNPFPGANPIFLSGDILYWDKLGYLYFKDRIGDTYRWKGENVSTTEVEVTLQKTTDVVDSCVFGVEVPVLICVGDNCAHSGYEGRAGMAAILPDPKCNISELLRHIGQNFASSLPSYAVPVFIRVLSQELEKTGTFKIKKGEQQKMSFELNDTSSVYILEKSNLTYKPLTSEARKSIVEGTLKL